MEKKSYGQDASRLPPLPYPGPPECVEQTFPPPAHFPPTAMQDFGMSMQPYIQMPNTVYPPPIVQQPVNPYVPNNLPPVTGLGNGDFSSALGFLATTTHLRIQQQFEILEMITGFETENKYCVLNENNQPVFYAEEKSDCCARQCCGPARPMEVRIYDIFQNEIIHLNRPLACQMCCCWCCLQTMEVTFPPGTVISNIKQQCSLYPKFNVNDSTGETMLKIEGPFWTVSCGGDVKFAVNSAADGCEIGSICKKWGGFFAEAFTDADNYGLSFPQDLSINCKMALLGAVFLIDMMYFERKPNR